MRTFFLLLITNFLAAAVSFGQSRTLAADTLSAAPQKQSTFEKIENRLNSRVTRVKINPLVILSGDMPVYVEHQLKDKMSAEVSVGYTYDNTLSDLLDNGNQPDLSITKEGLNSYSLAAALRYYPSEKSNLLEGYYFAPELRFRDYRSKITEIGGESFNLKQSRQVFDGKLVIGHIKQTDSGIFFDFYGGVGMRYKFYNDRVENYAVIYDPATNTTFTQVKQKDELRRGLLLSLGFKMGFSF